jgi:ABC-type branched-subunit amino acid transport system ATPase component
MVKLIIGRKGSGKTKKLIDLVNAATEASKGNVVCVEKGDTLTYSITHKARLIDAESYGISGYGELYALLCGIQSANRNIKRQLVFSPR